jgi:putative methyltransferase (TIGR04325 family)
MQIPAYTFERGSYVKNILFKSQACTDIVDDHLKLRGYSFFGNYGAWEDAQADSIGYDSDLILQKVKNSLARVINGEAAYERDSMAFDRIEYAWAMLSAILWATSQCNNTLNIIDFGGSLGGTYYQHRNFLDHVTNLSWNVIEQHNFVDCGRQNFQNKQLKFYQSIAECLTEQKPNIILLSGVLPYLKNPYEIIREIINKDIPYLIIDRTPFLASDSDRLTVQKTSAVIYEASYPAWFFGENGILNLIKTACDIVAEYPADSQELLLVNPGDTALVKGFICRRK